MNAKAKLVTEEPAPTPVVIPPPVKAAVSQKYVCLCYENRDGIVGPLAATCLELFQDIKNSRNPEIILAWVRILSDIKDMSPDFVKEKLGIK